MTAAFVEYNSKAAVFVFRQILCLYKNPQRIAAVNKCKKRTAGEAVLYNNHKRL